MILQCVRFGKGYLHKMDKKGINIYEVLLHLILIAFIFGAFIFATVGRAGSKGVKQQVVEKQIALLIDSAESGMTFSVTKFNMNGAISKLWVEEGKVHALIENQKQSNGYPFFSKYDVSFREDENKFYLGVS